MASPFNIEPSSAVFVEENSTVQFIWEIESCDWEVRIVTEEHTLYPNFNIDPAQVPVKLSTDYNISVTPKMENCKESIMNISVFLSVTFRESVLEHIKYIICKVSHPPHDDNMTYKSRVDIIAVTPPSESETTVTLSLMSTMVMPTNSIISYPIIDATTDSGCKNCQSLHFNVILLHIFFAFLSLLLF